MGKNTGLVLCTIGALVIVSMVRCQSNRGTPGVDYPNYFSIPETSFSCNKQKYIPGFYADIETQCQAFHFCYQNRQESFLCPTGTIFNQEILACDPWNNFNCSLAPSFFSKNAGPAMAKAGKNIPMLLKLRSTQGRSKMQAPKKVYDKVETPYETRMKSEETLKDSRESESLDTGPTSKEVSLKEEAFINSHMKEDGEPDVLADIEENDVQDIEESPDFSAQNENVEDIVYDPVTDGYYTKYDQYEPAWQPESESVSDEFSSFYEYANQPQEDEEMVKEPIGEFRDEENQILEQSSDALDLSKVIDGALDETTDFSKRLMEADPQSKRIRRKPLYVVVPDEEDEPSIKLPGRPRRNFEGSTSAMEQSSEANDTSEEQSEQDRNEPFPRPTRIPSHLLNHTTEVPMTSEEFGAAINEELVEPYLTLADVENLTLIGCSGYGCNLGSTQMQQESSPAQQTDDGSPAQQTDDGSPAQQTDDGSPAQQTDDGSPAQQTDDGSPAQQTDDGSPAQQTDMQSDQPSDDTYGFEYAGYGDEAQRGAYANLHSDPSYRRPTGISEDADETFVVIPDELDMPSTVETAPTGAGDQRTPISQMYDDDYSQYRSSFESPEAYGSYQFRPPPPPVHGFGNYPEGWRRDYQHYLSNVRDRYYQNQYGVQMNQPAGYEHPYRGPESPYFYDNVYPGSHPQQSGGENYESDYTNDYADPESAVWVTSSSEDGELSDVAVATQSPTLDITEASRIDVESSSIADLGPLSDDTVNVLSPEDMREDDEKYYVFDFDEEELEAEKDESEMLKEPDSTKPDGQSDFNELPDLKESYETEQVESLDEGLDSNDKLHGESNKSESREEISSDSEYSTSEHKKIEYPSELGMEEEKASGDIKSLTTESSRASEEPVTLSSAFERLAALKTQPPSLQSYDFSKDPSFLNDAAFPESMDFGPYGYGSSMGQQYGMLDSTNTKNGNKFVHRTGESEQSRLSKLSAIQDRIRSVKKGKFGMFKKYMGSTKSF